MKIVQILQARDVGEGDKILTESGWKELKRLDMSHDGEFKLCWSWDEENYYSSDYDTVDKTAMLVVLR